MKKSDGQGRFLIWAVLFACLAWGHYGLTPVSDFVGDDWAFLSYGMGRQGASIALETIRDYYRPLNMLASRMSFYWLGDRPWAFSVLRVLLHGGVLAVFLCLAWRLFHSRRALWTAGAVYAFTPILYDEFHWGNHIVLLYYPMAMLGAVLLWLQWIESGRKAWKVGLSFACYLVALASYENCVPLCLVFPLVGVLYGDGKRWRWSIVHVGLAMLWCVYRFTHGFGGGIPAIDAGYYAGGGGVGVVALLQNTRTILSWWVGGQLGQSFLGGFNVWAELLPKWQFAFAAVSLALLLSAWGAARGALSGHLCPVDKNRVKKNLAFGLAWMALAYSPHLLFPACSRHNLLPVFGAGIAIAALLDLTQAKIPAWAWIGAGFLCMLANAGNGLAWRDAGEFSRRLYQSLAATKSEWADKRIVVFDTCGLRERQTRGILKTRDDRQETWACHENSILLRGFVVSGMLKLCGAKDTKGLLDVEYGTEIRGDVLYWHERYNPDVPHQTPMDEVHVVDCLDTVVRAGR